MNKIMNKTKIICTIGPASDSKEVFTELVRNGLNVARINLSHGTRDYIKKLIDMVKEVREELGAPIPILMDTRGPEVRTKNFVDGSIELEAGKKVTLTTGNFLGTAEKFPITYENLAEELTVGQSVLIDDGLIELEVVEIDGKDVVCEVLNGGIVKNHKGINVPRMDLNLPPLKKEDISDLIWGIGEGIDYVAASFIRNADDVKFIRDILDKNGGNHIHIISKIESQTGIDNIDEIIKVSNGIMVARGDLGVEVPSETIPKAQKHIIMKCNHAGIPVIIATQMLDSMINNPRPTRAEVSDVANAVYDGTDTIMLSGETASGKYPVEAVKIMRKIVLETEMEADYESMYKRIAEQLSNSVTNAVCFATCTTAKFVDAASIICPTYSGKTARLISMFRPEAAILAPTMNPVTCRQLNMLWGVVPVILASEASADVLFFKATEVAKKKGVAESGDKVVVTAGLPLNTKGSTNLMRVLVAE